MDIQYTLGLCIGVFLGNFGVGLLVWKDTILMASGRGLLAAVICAILCLFVY